MRESHQEFGFLGGGTGSRAQEVYTPLESGAPGQDCNGHGTHVAASAGGLTYGVAKNASLLAVRALECFGNGTVSQVLPMQPRPTPSPFKTAKRLAASSAVVGATSFVTPLPSSNSALPDDARCMVIFWIQNNCGIMLYSKCNALTSGLHVSYIDDGVPSDIEYKAFPSNPVCRFRGEDTI